MTKQKSGEDFDPRLGEAMAKIEAIAQESNLKYSFVLSSKTHTEYKTNFPEYANPKRSLLSKIIDTLKMQFLKFQLNWNKITNRI